MHNRILRRRAIARGAAFLAALALPLSWRARPAAAQYGDLPGDLPSSDPPPILPPAAPVSPDELPPSPQAAGDAPAITQVGDDQPPDAPAPGAAAVPAVPMGVPPVKIAIPALGVEAMIEAVSDDPDGAMSAPSDPDEVAWYERGPGMGVPGNVVFAGHINWAGRTRAFGLLDRLDPGDVIQVIDAKGRGFEYAVESSHWVRAEGAPVEEIFAQPTEPVITLITCGGEYVASRREYLDRLIVRARGA
jgi:hypothetical protein